MLRRHPVLTALVAGLCLCASVPPWGFWVAAPLGVVLADAVVEDEARTLRPIQRLGRAWFVWAALLFPSMFWMRALTAPGYVIASLTYAGFLATGTVTTPRGPGRYLAIPSGVVFAEYVRWHWPFGGVPLSNLAMGQVAGPLAPLLRIGGALFVVWATVLVGMGVAALVRRRVAIGGALLGVVLALIVLGAAAPAGDATGRFLDVALVQGGGPQGTRAATTEPGIVLERHLAATEALTAADDLDLVLWPEDVVDVVTLAGSEEERQLAEVARRTDAVFIAGVIEDEGDDAFRNWAVAYDRDGEEVARYEKVERVPFGEWVPFRGLLESIAGDALPPRDARIGTLPATIETPVGPIGVSISWEIFFGERGRAAISSGGQLLLNPTNGASFEGTQVQTQQVASSRLRAVENGRWVTQIAPTGFSAVITPEGDVLQRTAVSERKILFDTIELRTGRTIYNRVGHGLALVVAVLGTATGWLADRRGWWRAEARRLPA